MDLFARLVTWPFELGLHAVRILFLIPVAVAGVVAGLAEYAWERLRRP